MPFDSLLHFERNDARSFRLTPRQKSAALNEFKKLLDENRTDGTLFEFRSDRKGKGDRCGNSFIKATYICHKNGVAGYQSQLRSARKSGQAGRAGKIKDAIAAATIDRRLALREKQVKRLSKKLREAKAAANDIKPGGIGELDPAQIKVDPDRFQYKRLSNKRGEVGSLSGVKKYDPNLAGVVQAWKDPSNGETYIVNGHNRLALAQRAGADKIAVRMLDVPDAKTARAVGALSNIAEGRGDAIDSAKFFRDSNISREDLERKGIPMREKIATDGLAISKLESSLYRRTVSGDIPIERATIIGAADLSDEHQRSLSKLIDSRSKGRQLTNDVVRELVDTAKSSATQTQTTLSLFGEEEVRQSLAIEKAQLQAGIKRRLAKEKRLFGTVAKSGSAKSLKRGGNVIDKERSAEISKRSGQVLASFDQQKNLKGDISDAVNAAAFRIANGESARKVESELYKQVFEKLSA